MNYKLLAILSLCLGLPAAILSGLFMFVFYDHYTSLNFVIFLFLGLFAFIFGYIVKEKDQNNVYGKLGLVSGAITLYFVGYWAFWYFIAILGSS